MVLTLPWQRVHTRLHLELIKNLQSILGDHLTLPCHSLLRLWWCYSQHLLNLLSEHLYNWPHTLLQLDIFPHHLLSFLSGLHSLPRHTSCFDLTVTPVTSWAFWVVSSLDHKTHILIQPKCVLTHYYYFNQSCYLILLIISSIMKMVQPGILILKD